MDQQFPLAYTDAKQVLYSCNKIGESLFKPNRVDFDLSDNYLNHNRITVEYHPLYDPALKSYYNRRPVRKRLIELQEINDKDDAICSKRYFFDYVRYLEQRRTDKLDRRAKRMNQQLTDSRAKQIKWQPDEQKNVTERRQRLLRALARKRLKL